MLLTTIAIAYVSVTFSKYDQQSITYTITDSIVWESGFENLKTWEMAKVTKQKQVEELQIEIKKNGNSIATYSYYDRHDTIQFLMILMKYNQETILQIRY
eukprot:NODE_131_length_16689_cov_0.437914.p20 type:complete len:100 gc:universal NODE_131_length_16689_cov_0.437914:7415-7116(-)